MIVPVPSFSPLEFLDGDTLACMTGTIGIRQKKKEGIYRKTVARSLGNAAWTKPSAALRIEPLAGVSAKEADQL